MVVDQAGGRQRAVHDRRASKTFSGTWFGGQRLATGSLPTDRLFTGQIRDLGDDRFYFFKARYYDATIGKFVQPDTVVADAGDPQVLNRYAYALNSPLRYVDPTGHASQHPDLDYSLDQLNAMNWQQRRDWLARFQKEYGTGGWFNNVDGILDYFSKSPTFSDSPYMHLADAGVLKAIEDGKAAALGYRSLPGGAERDAASKWRTFFLAQQRRASTFAELSQLWGSAEQAGVEWGTGLMAPATPAEAQMNSVFVAFGNDYRSLVTEGVQVDVSVGGRHYGTATYLFDPRNDGWWVDPFALVTEVELFTIPAQYNTLRAQDPVLSP